MPEFDIELLLSDATALLALVDAGELSCEALARQTLAAISTLNGSLNCYTAIDAEAALRDARAADQRRRAGRARSRLDGLTVAVKDNIDVAGFVTTAGLGLQRPAADVDAPVVKSLREAGCDRTADRSNVRE